MCGTPAIGRYHGPLIPQGPGFPASGVHHGFHREHHSVPESRSGARFPEIGNLRGFMQPSSDTVTRVFPHHLETGLVDHFMNGVGDIPQAISLPGLGDSGLQTLPGSQHEATRFVIHLSHGNRPGRIRIESPVLQARIDLDQIPGLQYTVP